MPILAPVVDTLLLEQRRLLRANKGIKSGDLRLHYCRQRYGLPDYPAHDALTDALATAELLSAWAIHAGGKQGVRLKQCFV
jgi:DNA polymerase-3 subunit epsilon